MFASFSFGTHGCGTSTILYHHCDAYKTVVFALGTGLVFMYIIHYSSCKAGKASGSHIIVSLYEGNSHGIHQQRQPKYQPNRFHNRPLKK